SMAAVKDEVIANLERSVFPPVDQHRGPGEAHDRIVVLVRKVLDGFVFQRKGHSQAQDAVRLEKLVDLLEGALNRDTDMLEHVARQDEIVCSMPLGMGLGDIDA